MYLRSVLSPSLQAKIDPLIEEGVLVFREPRNCIGFIQSEFNMLYPEQRRWKDYFCVKQ